MSHVNHTVSSSTGAEEWRSECHHPRRRRVPPVSTGSLRGKRAGHVASIRHGPFLLGNMRLNSVRIRAARYSDVRRDQGEAGLRKEPSLDKNSPSELDRIFPQIIPRPLGLRLVQQLRDTIKALFEEPGDFLRNSLLPGRNWFPGRLLSAATEAARSLVAHPVRFVAGAFAPDEIGRKRQRRFIPLLTVSVVAHSVLIAVLFVVAMLSPFWVPIVDTKYNEPDWTKILAPLHYPPGMLGAPSSQAPPMTIEEIRKRALER